MYISFNKQDRTQKSIQMKMANMKSWSIKRKREFRKLSFTLAIFLPLYTTYGLSMDKAMNQSKVGFARAAMVHGLLAAVQI